MSKWQDPGSVQMGILGYFFKLSYVMKDYHKILTEDYKFSTWVSYAFFTAATILVGGLLGLLAVFCLDCLRFSTHTDVNVQPVQPVQPVLIPAKPDDTDPTDASEEIEEKSPEDKKTE